MLSIAVNPFLEGIGALKIVKTKLELFFSGIRKPELQNILGRIYNSAPASNFAIPFLQSEISSSIFMGTSKPITFAELKSLSQCKCKSGTRLLYMNRLGNGGTSGTWTTGSDERKKDNIATVTDALDKVNQLRGVDFNWKERYGGHADSGVIAQEVEPILPHLVITQDGAKDKDDDGNMVNMKNMNYNGLWGVMIEAIKELTARVEELEK